MRCVKQFYGKERKKDRSLEPELVKVTELLDFVFPGFPFFTWFRYSYNMGAGASAAPFPTADAALSAGKTQEEIDAYILTNHAPKQLSDPWSSLPITQILLLLTSTDEPEGVVPTTVTVGGAADDVEQSIRAVVDNNTGGRTHSVVMDDSTLLQPYPFDSTFWSSGNVVSLNYAGGALLSFSVPSPNILRQLNLSGCPLTHTPLPFSSTNLSSLLLLDFSFTELNLFECDFSSLTNLRSLALESCSLETLVDDDDSSPLFSLVALETLNLADNDLSEMDAVVPALKELVSTLLDLDLRENDLRETMGSVKYSKLLVETVFGQGPLIKLDGRMLNRGGGGGGGSGVMLSSLEGIREAVGGNDEIVKSNEDRGSCSCLAGNPCVEKYNCKDWKNRYKIAKEIRKMKGMEEVPGLG